MKVVKQKSLELDTLEYRDIQRNSLLQSYVNANPQERVIARLRSFVFYQALAVLDLNDYKFNEATKRE